jgi:hypothetical protein
MNISDMGYYYGRNFIQNLGWTFGHSRLCRGDGKIGNCSIFNRYGYTFGSVGAFQPDTFTPARRRINFTVPDRNDKGKTATGKIQRVVGKNRSGDYYLLDALYYFAGYYPLPNHR